MLRHGGGHRGLGDDARHLPLAVQGLSGVERVSWKPLEASRSKQSLALSSAPTVGVLFRTNGPMVLTTWPVRRISAMDTVP